MESVNVLHKRILLTLYPTSISTESLNKAAKTTKEKGQSKITAQALITVRHAAAQLLILIAQRLRISKDLNYLILGRCRDREI